MAEVKESKRRGRKDLPIVLRAANILVTVIFIIAYWFAAAEFGLGGIDGYLPEKLCVAMLVASAVFGSILIMNQTLKDAGPVTLTIAAAAGVACGYALPEIAKFFIPSAVGVSRLYELDIVKASMASCAFYLMIWERNSRVELGADDLIDAMRSTISLWPMLLLYMFLLGVEFLIW